MISVIMSTFNEKIEHLKLSIESILNQTYKNFEFIVVLDNPHNKDIYECVRKYANVDSRMIVLSNEKNLGLTTSLNKALSYCHGEFIARMDADDISDSNRFEVQLKYIESNCMDLIGCMTRRISEDGVLVNNLTNISRSPEYISKKLMYDNCIAHPTWLVRKNVFDTLKRYRNIWTAEDYDFLLRAKKAGFRLGICNKCLFSYRINTSGISRSNSLRQLLTSHTLQKEYDKLESVNQEYIDLKIEKYLTANSNICFEKGVCLIDKAMEQVKQKNPIALLTIIQAICCSRYICIKLYKILKIHTISE